MQNIPDYLQDFVDQSETCLFERKNLKVSRKDANTVVPDNVSITPLKINLENPNLLQEFKDYSDQLTFLHHVCQNITDNPNLFINNLDQKMTYCDLIDLIPYSYDYYQINLGYSELIKTVKSENEVDTWEELFVDLTETIGFWTGFGFLRIHFGSFLDSFCFNLDFRV